MGSPPDKITSDISSSVSRYRGVSAVDSSHVCPFPTARFLLQNLQYMAHSELTRNTPLPGYRFKNEGVTPISASSRGSGTPPGFNSRAEGTACRRIGQAGFAGSINAA